jgi:hypothetical protein
MSIARRQPTRSASMCSGLPCRMEASSMAARRLLAAPIGMDVAGEVQVEVLHRDDLGHAAAGGAALDAEDRPQRGLAQAGARALADDAEPLRQADQRGRLALAGLGRRHAGDAHELAVGGVLHAVEDAEVDLRLVAPVGLELLVFEPTSSAICSMGLRTASWAISRLLFTMAPWSVSG